LNLHRNVGEGERDVCGPGISTGRTGAFCSLENRKRLSERESREEVRAGSQTSTVGGEANEALVTMVSQGH